MLCCVTTLMTICGHCLSVFLYKLHMREEGAKDRGHDSQPMWLKLNHKTIECTQVQNSSSVAVPFSPVSILPSFEVPYSNYVSLVVVTVITRCTYCFLVVQSNTLEVKLASVPLALVKSHYLLLLV